MNVSRGTVLSELALVEALKSKHLGGDGLDVLEPEPTNSSRWAGIPNVVPSPYQGGTTYDPLFAIHLGGGKLGDWIITAEPTLPVARVFRHKQTFSIIWFSCPTASKLYQANLMAFVSTVPIDALQLLGTLLAQSTGAEV